MARSRRDVARMRPRLMPPSRQRSPVGVAARVSERQAAPRALGGARRLPTPASGCATVTDAVPRPLLCRCRTPRRTRRPARWSPHHRMHPESRCCMSVESTEALERSVLEGKDREQLLAIASALGVKANSRAKKGEIIDQILEQIRGERRPPAPHRLDARQRQRQRRSRPAVTEPPAAATAASAERPTPPWRPRRWSRPSTPSRRPDRRACRCRSRRRVRRGRSGAGEAPAARARSTEREPRRSRELAPRPTRADRRRASRALRPAPTTTATAAEARPDRRRRRRRRPRAPTATARAPAAGRPGGWPGRQAAGGADRNRDRNRGDGPQGADRGQEGGQPRQERGRAGRARRGRRLPRPPRRGLRLPARQRLPAEPRRRLRVGEADPPVRAAQGRPRHRASAGPAGPQREEPGAAAHRHGERRRIPSWPASGPGSRTSPRCSPTRSCGWRTRPTRRT